MSNPYQWTDNPMLSGISTCDPDIINENLMYLKFAVGGISPEIEARLQAEIEARISGDTHLQQEVDRLVNLFVLEVISDEGGDVVLGTSAYSVLDDDQGNVRFVVNTLEFT